MAKHLTRPFHVVAKEDTVSAIGDAENNPADGSSAHPTSCGGSPGPRLPAGALFLTQAMRQWVGQYAHQPQLAASLDPEGIAPQLHAAFRALGLAHLAGAFCFAMEVLNTRSSAPVMFGCCECGRLSPCEARLLAMVALLQEDRVADALGLMESWLTGTPAQACLAAWRHVAVDLRVRGFRVTAGETPAWASRPAGQAVH